MRLSVLVMDPFIRAIHIIFWCAFILCYSAFYYYKKNSYISQLNRRKVSFWVLALEDSVCHWALCLFIMCKVLLITKECSRGKVSTHGSWSPLIDREKSVSQDHLHRHINNDHKTSYLTHVLEVSAPPRQWQGMETRPLACGPWEDRSISHHLRISCSVR